MELKNLSDLAKLADLCRKKNIESIKITPDGIVEFKLAREAFLASPKRRRTKEVHADVPVNELSEEEILFWSSTPAGQEGAHN